MNDFDKWILESHGFEIVPAWLARGIEAHNPRISVGLASTKEYRLNKLDKVLGTVPLIQKIKVEVN